MLSLVMMTKNSDHYVERLLQQAKFFADKIYILVDDSTTDKTYDLCKDYATHIEKVKSPGYIEPVLSYLYDLPDTEWIIRLDDDELLGSRFIDNKAKILDTDMVAFWMPRYAVVHKEHYFANQPMYPDYQLRLFRKGRIVQPPIIHVTPTILGKSGMLNAHIFHMKFMYKSRFERAAIQKRYESIRQGAGTNTNYAPHQIPEEYYRGAIRQCEEKPYEV